MARPKKAKAGAPLDPALQEKVLACDDLQDAIDMMKTKGALVAPDPPASLSSSSAFQPVSNPDLPRVPEGEHELTPEGKAFLDAALLGQAPPPEQEVITPFTGYGNVPDVSMPKGPVQEYDFRAPEPPPKAPSRPRTPTQPKPQTYKQVADDAELMEIVTLRTKIEAYMRIKPELARQVAMPVRGSSAEDHRMALAQCRTMLSCGNEEVWLQWGLEYGAQFLEGMLPFVRERVPDAVAVQLNGEGFSDDVRKALSGESDALADIQLRTAMQLCAVDLIGLISVSPWAMLGMGMLQVFTRKVKKNNDMLRSQYMAQAARDGVRMNSEYDNL